MQSVSRLVSGRLGLLWAKGAAPCAGAAFALQRNAGYATDADSHDDFKPKYKGPVDVDEIIKQNVARDKVHIFMKGTPDMPQCGFSRTACMVLTAYGVEYGATNVLADPAVREGIKKFTSWPTIPQIFVNGEFIGGCDILMGMHDSGELDKLLTPIRQSQAQAAKK